MRRSRRPPRLADQPLVEELERRILLSAGVEGALLDPALALPAGPPVAAEMAFDANASNAVRHELVLIDGGVEDRDSLLADLSIALRAVISQRLVRTVDGKRVPAVEVLLNTKHIQELIKEGDISRIKDAMEQSLSPGSQTFEQALFHLYNTGKITIDEALANSDSPSNLHWLINNASKEQKMGGLQPSPDAQAAGAKPASSPDDLSSIKLNLDALG